MSPFLIIPTENMKRPFLITAGYALRIPSDTTRRSRDTTVVLQLLERRSPAYGQAERECRRLTLKVSNGIKKVSQRVTHTAPCTGGSSHRQLALFKFSFRKLARWLLGDSIMKALLEVSTKEGRKTNTLAALGEGGAII